MTFYQSWGLDWRSSSSFFCLCICIYALDLRQTCQLTRLKPVRRACEYKTRVTRLPTQNLVGGDFINTQNNDTWVIESWRSLFRRGFFQWSKQRKITETLAGGHGLSVPTKATPISAIGLDLRPLEFQAVAFALSALSRPPWFVLRMDRLKIYQCEQVCLVLTQMSRLTDFRAFRTLQAKMACKNVHYELPPGVLPLEPAGAHPSVVNFWSSISGSCPAMSWRVSNFSAENGCSQRKTYNGVTVPLRQQTD